MAGCNEQRPYAPDTSLGSDSHTSTVNDMPVNYSRGVTVRSQRFSSVRGEAAKLAVSHVLDVHYSVLDGTPGPQVPAGSSDANRSTEPPIAEPERVPGPICIVGAGCAGLYAAMILDSLGLQYEILEASERVGGRILTHRFNGDAGRNAPINDPARYDYIDIGAMRYPNIGFMTPVFKLFDLLDMTKDGLLIQYKYSAANTLELYNGIRVNSSDPAPPSVDVFGVSVTQGGAVPDNFVAEGVDSITSKIFKEYAEKFNDPNVPFEKAWEHLVQQDPFSTRSYIMSKNQYPESVVDWLETFNTATGLYNNAFVESTMDALDFGSATATTDAGMRGELDYEWYCIDGGSDHLTDRMSKKIKTKPATGMRVTKIRSSSSGGMDVTYQACDGKTTEKKYSQVICTVPLGCLAAIEIPREDLLYLQRMAIRSLNYDTSTKVALKFESRWWEDPSIMGGRTIKGGVSSTDIPIRTCVYPSYGFKATGKVPGVLLASYTWAQDAQRLGGLAQKKGTEADQRLVELTLENLSQLHDVPIEKFGPLVDHYAYNWHNDSNARGAFALFRPGQFGQTKAGYSMFASMTAPAAKGKLHIAGEATSVHHAWVLGALNSAWRAVYNALPQLDLPPSEIEKKKELLMKLWPIPDEFSATSLTKLAALARSKPEVL